jgi:membrane protease YdiL (CAAX protease family)
MPQQDEGYKQWGPVIAILGTIGIYLGAQLIAGLLISIYPSIKHWSQAYTNDWINHSIWAQFFLIGIVELLTLFLLKHLLLKFRANFKTLGVRWPRAKDIFRAVAGYIVYLIILVVAMGVLNKLFPQFTLDQKQDIGFTGAKGASLILVFCSLVILPAIVEEALVRGFLYMGLRSRLSLIPAALATSAIFASAHLQFGSGNPLVWSAAVDTFFLSLVLIYLREKTKGLAAPMTLHMIKNTVAFVSLFVFMR